MYKCSLWIYLSNFTNDSIWQTLIPWNYWKDNVKVRNWMKSANLNPCRLDLSVKTWTIILVNIHTFTVFTGTFWMFDKKGATHLHIFVEVWHTNNGHTTCTRFLNFVAIIIIIDLSTSLRIYTWQFISGYSFIELIPSPR